MDYTIEPYHAGYGGYEYAVYSHDEYPRGSVLEGQPRRCLADLFASVGQARLVYPTADVLGHSTRSTGPSVPSCEPGWFDEGAAGERWDSDY